MTPEYCRGARALLDWKQADLARRSNVSLTSVKAFEAGSGSTRAATVQAMQASLEDEGIDFLPGGGVRLQNDSIKSYHFAGQNCIERHNDLIYATLRTGGGEILTCSPDDTLWTGPLARKANAAFREWRMRLGIRGKTLAPIGSRIFNEPRHQYRLLSPELIGTLTYVIYAKRISFILWKPRQVFVLHNPLITDTFRRQFEFLWKLGRLPSQEE